MNALKRIYWIVATFLVVWFSSLNNKGHEIAYAVAIGMIFMSLVESIFIKDE